MRGAQRRRLVPARLALRSGDPASGAAGQEPEDRYAMPAQARWLFTEVEDFRRYLRALPPSFRFGPGTSLEDCPLAAWARTFRPEAVVALTHVAWEGSFGQGRVDRLSRWQEAFCRRALRYSLATGEDISREQALQILERVAPSRSRGAR